ncbi:ABC transporter ATP-binding protein [Lachnospiraceae bacterium 48-21]
MSYYLKKFWGANLTVIAIQICMYATQASFTLITVRFTQAILDLDLQIFLFWLGMLFAGWCVYLILDFFMRIFKGRAIRKMNNAVRRDMAATLLKKDYQTYHAQDNGEYLSWFTTGINEIENNAWEAFFMFTSYTAQVIANMVVLLSLQWSLFPLSLVSAALMLFAPKLFEKKLEHLGQMCAQGQAAAVSVLKDLLGGYDVLRFFGRSSRFSQGISEASEQIEEPAFRKTCKTGLIYDSIGIVNVFAQLIIHFYTGMLVFKGIIPYSVMAGVGVPTGAITNGLSQLSYFRMCFSTSKPYFERITAHEDGCNTQASQRTEPIQDSITVENVSFSYGEKPVLEGISASFRKGGKYALTGPSGCGKSTLLRLLLGWLPDYGGSIRFDGKNAKEFTTEQLQQQMSYIAQDVFLFNTTIRDNITLGEDFTEEQIQKALQASALAGDMANMPAGLDTNVGEEGSNLSGGQRQRVAIARALIHDRSILLVDEGTSALDQKNAGIVEESLLANPELTLILVSHHLAAERQAQFDYVYRLKTADA